MICKHCGNKIEYVNLGQVTSYINECPCGSIHFMCEYGQYHGEIKCPICNEYPFEQEVKHVSDLTRVIIKTDEDNL